MRVAIDRLAGQRWLGKTHDVADAMSPWPRTTIESPAAHRAWRIGRFWAQAALCLIALWLAGEFFHVKIVPPRMGAGDLLVFVPVLACLAVAIRPGRSIGAPSRWTFGLLQSVVLILIFSNWFQRDFLFGDVDMVIVAWVVAALLYATAFALITQHGAGRYARQQERPRTAARYRRPRRPAATQNDDPPKPPTRSV